MSMNREEKDFLRQVCATIVQTNMEMVANVEKRHEEKMNELKAMEERLERRTIIGFVRWQLSKLKRKPAEQKLELTKKRESFTMAIPIKGEAAA